MRVKELHPLCCITLESPHSGINNQLPEEPVTALTRSRSLPAKSLIGGSKQTSVGSEAETVAGILYKWTNFGKGWRSRWFLLRNGILSYSKIRRPENLNLLSPSVDVRLIGDISADRLSRMDSCSGRRKQEKTVGIVHLKVYNEKKKKKNSNFDFWNFLFLGWKKFHLRLPVFFILMILLISVLVWFIIKFLC